MRCEMTDSGVRLTPENESEEEWVNDLVVKQPKITQAKAVKVKSIGFGQPSIKMALAVTIGPKE